MTPRTRASNQDTDYKVYYSKKAPQQKHFPHKSKKVRRRSTPLRDDSGKRQMVFLPEKMRLNNTPFVEDSDAYDDYEDLEEDLEDGGVAIDPQADEAAERRLARHAHKKVGKRSGDVMQEYDSEDDEPVRPAAKRRRTAHSSKSNRRSKQVEAQDERNPDRARTMRRQSTMTQLIDGRRPSPGSEGLHFRPIKRSPRLSWGGKGKIDRAREDRKQRTLTQMVPGMRPSEIMSEEDLDEILSDAEAQEKDSQAYGDAIAQRLARQGLHRTEENGDKAFAAAQDIGDDQRHIVKEEARNEELLAYSQEIPSLVVQSIENDIEEDREDDYQPTQYIDAPVTRAGRTTRRKAAAQISKSRITEAVSSKTRKTGRSRFGLLATPEKKRIREIPSSQSPADSPLCTQVTPQKVYRSPLTNRSGNAVLAPETPSRRKQVTFVMPPKSPLPPPTLKKFQSTILDSEDEDDIVEEDLPSSGRYVGLRPQADMRNVETATPSNSVGADTQAVLHQIDLACEYANQDAKSVDLESSQDSNALFNLRSHSQPSPELGELHKQSQYLQKLSATEGSSYQTGCIKLEESACEVDEEATILPNISANSSQDERPIASDATTITDAELPAPAKQLHSTPPINEGYVQDTFPSTPMVIQDDSSDEEDEAESDPTPPRSSRQKLTQPSSTGFQQSADLDEQPIQVPRSPSPQHETQQSHSSKAEQQLQNEWLSYSQYVYARQPHSSSMRGAPDAFSYNDTPLPPRPTAVPPQRTGYHASQATTVDEITQRTPKKNRTQHLSSANTTPHRIASSQPVYSPNKPPPLFIPSSFPSPARVTMEGWSSPVLGQTQGGYRSSQWASLEDFSIPLPPPTDVDD